MTAGAADAAVIPKRRLWPRSLAGQMAVLIALALFVGFHSRAGTPQGLLSHTWAGAIVHEITVNGRVCGETALNAAICGAFGVPVGLVAGADDLIAEARADRRHRAGRG